MDAGDVNPTLWSVSIFVYQHYHQHLLNVPYVSRTLLNTLHTCENSEQPFVIAEESEAHRI